MRFAATLEFEHDKVHLPPWYRIGFASLIKEALQKGDPTGRIYNTYYHEKQKNIPKPFTFAVKLNVEKKVTNGTTHFLQVGKSARLYVSSNNYEFIIALYNGLITLKRYSIYSCPFSINHFTMLPKIECGTKQVFSIFSPFVVRRIDDNKKGVGYAQINDADFVQMLTYSIISQCKFLGDSYCVKPDDIVINTNAAFPVKIPHYNKNNPHKPEIIVATDGMITIEAPQEVVQLLYDNGIGARRSQGFGMLEVVG